MIPRNPWTGLHAGKELLYDLRHPALLALRAWEGVCGRNPHVTPEERWLGIGAMAFGLLNVAAGAAILIRQAA